MIGMSYHTVQTVILTVYMNVGVSELASISYSHNLSLIRFLCFASRFSFIPLDDKKTSFRYKLLKLNVIKHLMLDMHDHQFLKTSPLSCLGTDVIGTSFHITCVLVNTTLCL